MPRKTGAAKCQLTRPDGWLRLIAGSVLELPTLTQYRNQTAPYSEAISRSAVRVPNFHQLKVYGDFEVQVSGDPDVTSVSIEGPNDAVRSIAVCTEWRYIIVSTNKRMPPLNMNRVIVHVSMKSISSLSSYGNGRIGRYTSLFKQLISRFKWDRQYFPGRSFEC